MDTTTRENNAFLRKANLLFLGLSIASFLLALLVLLASVSRQPATTNLMIAGVAFIAAIFCVYNKKWQLTRIQFITIGLITIGGLFLSLFFHDDYGGGEYLFHIHLGFPFSWRHGGLSYYEAVRQGISLKDYVTQHPEKIQWFLDYRALIVDLLFWANVGFLIVTVGKAAVRFRKGNAQADLQ